MPPDSDNAAQQDHISNSAALDARWREMQTEAERVAEEVECQMPGGKWHAETLRTFMLRADTMFKEARDGT